jgi:hypothetical protein
MYLSWSFLILEHRFTSPSSIEQTINVRFVFQLPTNHAGDYNQYHSMKLRLAPSYLNRQQFKVLS